MNGHSVKRPTIGLETIGRRSGALTTRRLRLCRVRRGAEGIIRVSRSKRRLKTFKRVADDVKSTSQSMKSVAGCSSNWRTRWM